MLARRPASLAGRFAVRAVEEKGSAPVADGGRDLEAHFYTPAAADDNIEPQVWWIECKGRTGTVDANEVKNAVVNAQAKDKLDCIVVATNTQFSNPTIDWVKEWQKSTLAPSSGYGTALIWNGF